MAKNQTSTDSAVTELDEAPATASAPDAVTSITETADAPKRVSGHVPPGFSGKRRVVMIGFSEGEIGKLPVRLGIEGFVISVERGKKVAIYEEFVNQMRDELNEAVILDDGTRAGETPRFTFVDYGPAQ